MKWLEDLDIGLRLLGAGLRGRRVMCGCSWLRRLRRRRSPWSLARRRMTTRVRMSAPPARASAKTATPRRVDAKRAASRSPCAPAAPMSASKAAAPTTIAPDSSRETIRRSRSIASRPPRRCQRRTADCEERRARSARQCERARHARPSLLTGTTLAQSYIRRQGRSAVTLAPARLGVPRSRRSTERSNAPPPAQLFLR